MIIGNGPALLQCIRNSVIHPGYPGGHCAGLWSDPVEVKMNLSVPLQVLKGFRIRGSAVRETDGDLILCIVIYGMHI